MSEASGNGPRILIAAGGTGGHLYPALAVADRCRALDPSATIRFVGAAGRLEEEVVPRFGYAVDLLWISGFDRGNLMRNVGLPLKLVRSLMQAQAIVRRFRPDIIVCAGAYVSWPIGRVAIAKRIPLLLMESNALPGRVIKALAPKAVEVHAAFEEARAALPGATVIVSGNPVRRSLHEPGDQAEARRFFGLDPDRPTIMAVGGSQGARSINRALDKGSDAIIESGAQLIWQTGRGYEGEEVSERHLFRARYLHDIDKAFTAADLVVARAGATTIAELRAIGRPSILVPLPTAADDHQTVNAKAMVDAGASRMILDSRLDEELLPAIASLMNDTETMRGMGSAAARLAVLDADDRIARRILAIASRS